MHGLFRDAEPDSDLPPRPARATSGRDLLGFQLLHEPTETGYGPQPRVGIHRSHGITKTGSELSLKIDGWHFVSIC
ncbi:hypothetical protein BL253_28130 [Pseudofrankia asymbiotica]|uniref:Uncharacterized protein n=1 Tax=Pseudofrankia asymbiotica TaxID=1834516 RepID=A0A1V2I628_9ACTN|nr:hypothetical protein BL253_28130 [Pseudofrankia asymbiotica]